MPKKPVSTEVDKWLKCIDAYDRTFKDWEHRAEKIEKKYRDEQRSDAAKTVRFNILWSNVQTLSAATYARVPKPDVSRRFRDNDPVGRVSSLILERGLDYEVGHYSDYRATLKACVLDRFLGGRATAWVRYEPHFRSVEQPQGDQITEDVEAQDELDYECAPVDYVNWRDFGHSVARTWEEVTKVWRRVYMSMPAKIERFGEEVAGKIPQDGRPKESNGFKTESEEKGSWIYEGWDKETKEAVWFHKSMPEFLDRRNDPLGLEEFFPCPKPMYATLANDKLVPTPDYSLYQDQAIALDTLADRIAGLIDALRVVGVYDGSLKEITRIFTEVGNTQMVPIKNWGAFAEKGRLSGAMEFVDLKPVYEALEQAYRAVEHEKSQVYEITGISDIVRGQGDAGETATAQQIKGQFASLRLKTYQEEVANFATELLQIKAQIMCNKFAPETLLKISAADQLSQQDQQLVRPAMELLIGERLERPEAETQNPLRSFRVEIAADSLVYLDEKNEQESAVQFMAANSKFMADFVGMVQNSGPFAPALIPLGGELWKWGVRAFKAPKNIEGAFDEAIENLKKISSQPPTPPPPTPQDQANMAKAQVAMTQAKVEQATAPIRAQAEIAKANADGMGAQADVITAQTNLQQAALQAQNPGAFQTQ